MGSASGQEQYGQLVMATTLRGLTVQVQVQFMNRNVKNRQHD
jgi:hypothetical protein